MPWPSMKPRSEARFPTRVRLASGETAMRETLSPRVRAPRPDPRALIAALLAWVAVIRDRFWSRSNINGCCRQFPSVPVSLALPTYPAARCDFGAREATRSPTVDALCGLHTSAR